MSGIKKIKYLHVCLSFCTFVLPCFAETLNVTNRAETNEGMGSGITSGDYNNDGYADVIVRVSSEVGGAGGRGSALNIIYGGRSSDGRLGTSNNTLLTMADFTSQDGLTYKFSSMATADFNNDGYDDVALGSPSSDYFADDGGMVNIAFGSAQGITTSGAQYWGLGSGSEDLQFGKDVAAGDFNRDGYADLAISMEPYGPSGPSGGKIYILFGTSSGLTAQGFQSIVHANTASFGPTLESGDFDGDGYADLAIGTPDDNIAGNPSYSGFVHILYGGGSGLSHDQLWHQDSSGIKGVAEYNDNFGDALAAGDFDNDGYDDLAIGATREKVDDVVGAGAVNVLYGSSSGISDRDQIWHQNSSGIDGACETNELFGATLAVGDFNNDGRDDLAVGVQYESIGDVVRAGAVNIILGGSSGLRESNNYMLHQNKSGVDSSAEYDDAFGAYLDAIDIDGDGRSELLVGVSGEGITRGGVLQERAGAAHAIYFGNFSSSTPVVFDQFIYQ